MLEQTQAKQCMCCVCAVSLSAFCVLRMAAQQRDHVGGIGEVRCCVDVCAHEPTLTHTAHKPAQSIRSSMQWMDACKNNRQAQAGQSAAHPQSVGCTLAWADLSSSTSRGGAGGQSPVLDSSLSTWTASSLAVSLAGPWLVTLMASKLCRFMIPAAALLNCLKHAASRAAVC